MEIAMDDRGALISPAADDHRDNAVEVAGESAGWATYRREIGRVRRLTAAEELELGAQIAAGDEDALRRLVEANLRLVITVATRYRHEGIELQDLIQEGNIGLLRAAQKFDYRKGFRFSTYAMWWIRQAVSRAVAKHAYAIRVPLHIQEGRGQAERSLAALRAVPTAHETADAPATASLAASALQVARTLELARRARQTVSLDHSTGEDADLGAAVAEDTALSPFDLTANTLLHERLVDLLQTLPVRERAIISLRYGLVDGRMYTCAEVGARIHLTRERVRQLEMLALRTLREAPGGAALAGYLA